MAKKIAKAVAAAVLAIPTDPVWVIPAGFGFSTIEVATKSTERSSELMYEFKDKFLAIIKAKMAEAEAEMVKILPGVKLVDIDFMPAYSADYNTGVEKPPRPACKPVKAEKPAKEEKAATDKPEVKTVEELSNVKKPKKAAKKVAA